MKRDRPIRDDSFGAMPVILWMAGVSLLTIVGIIAVLNFFPRAARGETRDNPYDPRLIALGRQLFFDPRMAADNTVSCATCHVPARGWTDNRNVAIGIRNQLGTRNTPPIFNVEDEVTKHFFWDGVSFGLEAQVFRPIQNPVEHGNVRAEDAVAKLNQTGYRQISQEIWGRPLTLAQLSNAIAWYMRTIQIDDSPEHRYRAGDFTALTAAQKRGRAHFERIGCASCHNGTNLRDGKFHNTGVSIAFGDNDQGVFNVTRNEASRRAFKTQTLWNLADTAPYFHAGRAVSIDDVLDHYNRGGTNLQGQVDPLIDRRVLAIRGQLSDQQVRAELKDWLMNACRGTLPIDTAPELPR